MIQLIVFKKVLRKDDTIQFQDFREKKYVKLGS